MFCFPSKNIKPGILAAYVRNDQYHEPSKFTRIPRKDAIGTWIFLVDSRKLDTSNFVNESNPINTKSVKPTKTETCIYASIIDWRITLPNSFVWKANDNIKIPKNAFFKSLASLAKIIFFLSISDVINAFIKCIYS